MSGYDSWLERPYTDRAAASDAYQAWCERNGLDPDDDHWDEYDTDQAQDAEDAALAKAEARAEAAL